MSRRAVRRWITGVIPLLAIMPLGCASSQNPFLEDEVGAVGGRTLQVWVRNSNRSDIFVTLLGSGGDQVSLGRLLGRRSEMFEVKWRPNMIRARLEFVDGGRYTTPSLLLSSERSVILQVESPLNRSVLRKN